VADVTDIDSLPPPLQRAIAARDAGVEPFNRTIDSLHVSWRIVEGNLNELLATLDMFDTNDQVRATSMWRQTPPAKQRYHCEIVRRLHNLLSAAVAHLDHTRRAATLFKRFVPESYQDYCRKQDLLDDRLGFLIVIRDFSIHTGTHESVLQLRGTAEGTMVGRVGFSVRPLLSEQQARLATARSRREKAAASAAIKQLETAGTTVEIRPLIFDCYEQMNEHRIWFRQELIRVHELLSNDLGRWASPQDRAAVVQYFVDNPIPVYGNSIE